MIKPTPKTVVPVFAVESVDEIRRYYVEALGFQHIRGVVGSDGQFDFCTVAKDGARIMFARAPGECRDPKSTVAKQPVGVYLEVADVDLYFGQISKNKDVKMTEQLVTQWWGDRTFKVMDPHGYELWFHQNVSEPKPPKDMKIV